MIKRLSHLGLAVRDLEAGLALYRDLFGLEVVHRELVADQGVETVSLRLGEAQLELLRPTSEASPVGKFLARHGEGIHHLAYLVDDLQAELAALAQRGVPLIDDQPRRGAGGRRIAFLHPRATGGVLTELCEEPGGER